MVSFYPTRPWSTASRHLNSPLREHFAVECRCDKYKATFSREDDMTIAIEKPALSSAAAKFLAKEQKFLIDGKSVAAKSGQTFPVEDPRQGRSSLRFRRGTRPI